MESPSDNPRRASSVDVARAANVSQSAVSRTFTPGASVSQATRDKVMAAAQALGYQPNRLPRMLHGKRTDIVAVVVGGLSNPFHAAALDRITARLEAAGKFVKLVRVESDQVLDEVVRDLVGYRVDAVVSALAVQDVASAAALDRLAVPLLRLAPGAEGTWMWTVMSDASGLGRAAARLLIDAGCRRLAFLSGEGGTAQDLRGDGFVAEAQSAGVEVRRARAPGHDHAAGMAGFRALIGAGQVDGLMCGNDLVACGAIDAARMAGLTVPADLRVVGCDNIPQADWPPYRLTTFDQDVDALANRVVDMLAAPLPDEHVIVLPAALVRRDSA